MNCKLTFPPDEGGATLITESYGAQYGYTVSILPAWGLVELRASYFSHHTFNQVYSQDESRCTNCNPHSDISGILLFQGDSLFMFSFNLIVSRDGEDVKHPLNKTCSPALAWAPREVTCEVNYMEVTKLLNESEQKL